MNYDKKTADRFWSKVDRSGGPDACWPWQGARKPAGYGNFFTGRDKNRRIVTANAHRFAYALTNGEIGADEYVRHMCDNPPCCNPAHLVRGTPTDNAQDAISRGRFNFSGIGKRGGWKGGATNGKRTAKLTDDQARALLVMFDEGVPRVEIGACFQVPQSTVYEIANGTRYRWVPEVAARAKK